MRDIYRILKVGSELWRSYILISFLTILISLLTVLQPLISGWAIDEIGKGASASVTYAAILAASIFVLDLLQNLISNYNGFTGDQIQAKLIKLLSEKYFNDPAAKVFRY